ncbi:UDP-glucose 4-epimerase [Spizellomyces punctatus DAOM BR117]|uniref:UDP-glucose 4-epimerase n=1 Tax=Spizellomyces punctatus (strain DAOM BR117) TaxID=645134 RepID=A0A0L0HI00_SPIPD|nr:UDP-glucose 4-epimerase [Spizellomyces punctatus DAOM BR117]KND00449.1 UDP-glucose 4-epimerase [Spizellomyces punctatus DAOM BR117]|eukprot:XP_016608488.1 UDP-glucose 4-epimerase [Spizellomyces punctatus DAOM BR117]
MKILIAGGAGYIGSHLVRELHKLGKHEIIVLDNLSTGHTAAIPQAVTFEQGDIRDKQRLDEVFAKHKPVAVYHLSASIEVAQSCVDPLSYYENNVSGTVTLLQIMQKYGSKYFIFSSTAALFGMPDRIPIEADDTTKPVNPYGETKLAVEKILHWCDQAFGLKYVCLRYFNACGADEAGDIGEDHTPESHLIPLVLQVPAGKREKVFIFGDDYDTEDGTCVRDYVHVTDLASAHIQALDYLGETNESNRFNLGSGHGYSVKQIIDAARRVTGHPIPAEIKPRRAGDPATLVASSTKAEKVLGWKRKYDSIDKIVATAWKFHQLHPKGF